MSAVQGPSSQTPTPRPGALRSMTGFGAAALESAELGVRVELRSVNHRYLLVKCRLPGELTFLESEVEALLKKRLSRGSVSVHVSAERRGAATGATIDAELAKAYRDQLRELAASLGLDEEPRLDLLLGLPGVLVSEREGEVAASEGKLVLEAVGEAATALVRMREREGTAMAADLRKHAGAIEKLTERIAKRMPVVVSAAQKSLRKRVNELLDGRHVASESDLAREIAAIADRADIAEELARLDSHLVQLLRLLDKGGSVGRRLDFLVQEMFREINTVGSKCADAKVAHMVVDVKTRIERLREQVQNVE